jgi:hypothetical protein
MRGRNTTGVYIRFPDSEIGSLRVEAAKKGYSFPDWLRYVARAARRGEIKVPEHVIEQPYISNAKRLRMMRENDFTDFKF